MRKEYSNKQDMNKQTWTAPDALSRATTLRPKIAVSQNQMSGVESRARISRVFFSLGSGTTVKTTCFPCVAGCFPLPAQQTTLCCGYPPPHTLPDNDTSEVELLTAKSYWQFCLYWKLTQNVERWNSVPSCPDRRGGNWK